MNTCVISLGNKRFFIYLHYLKTAQYFQNYYSCQSTSKSEVQLEVLSVNKCELLQETKRLKNPYFAEYSLLFSSITNLILPHNCFFFHGVAFIWKYSAFLFTGHSGVGKTTQLLNWLKLYSDEIELINGDKPLIEMKDSEFIVHPSPWGGKEGFNGTRSAELKGIILLEQGSIDQISRMDIHDAVYPLFLQFLYKPQDMQAVDYICNYEEQLLNSIPVWKLVNRGSEESAVLTHSYLSREVFHEL